MRIASWLIRAFIFFTLFAFALNNQHGATVRWFFGLEWRAPMAIVVLVAFAGGAAVGVLAMVPNWWRARRVAQGEEGTRALQPPAQPPAASPPTEHPPREGLGS